MRGKTLCLGPILVGLLYFSACGGGSSTPSPPPTYSIGGSVTGLAGSGLVLQDNSGDNLAVPGATFTFAGHVTSGGAYKVTVLTQPSDPTQACVVTNGSGTASANVTNVLVTCTTIYTIGGTISGLAGAGLVLQDNGGDNYQTLQNGPFTFATPVTPGSAYSVTVLTQPANPKQNCVVTNGGGMASANVTSVQVTCTTITFTVGGSVSGLSGGGLVLQDNAATTSRSTRMGTSLSQRESLAMRSMTPRS